MAPPAKPAQIPAPSSDNMFFGLSAPAAPSSQKNEEPIYAVDILQNATLPSAQSTGPHIPAAPGSSAPAGVFVPN